MFKFLKEKLKKGISQISRKIDEQGEEQVIEKRGFIEKIKGAFSKETNQESTKEPVEEDKIEKKLESEQTIKKPEESKIAFPKETITVQKSTQPVTTDEDKKLDNEQSEKKGIFKRIKSAFSKGTDKEDITVPHSVEPIQTERKKVQIQAEKKSKETNRESIIVQKSTEPIQIEVVMEDKIKKTEKKRILKKGIETFSKGAKTENVTVQKSIEPILTERIIEKQVQIVKENEKNEILKKSKGTFHKETDPKFDRKSEKLIEIETIEELNSDSEQIEKKGFFGAIKEMLITKKINEDQFEKFFWDLEVALLESNVAVEAIDKIKADLKNDLVDKPIIRSNIEKKIMQCLLKSVEDLLHVQTFDLIQRIKQKKPFVICFVGINGSGKTTTIAKIAKLLQKNKISCVMAASDTFRAASIEQLQLHADKLQLKLIKHDYGSDPAAVAFDAIEHAKSKKIDVVLIDTAGRIHSNINLTDEMKKIVRVAKPDLKIFVGESITGNDCVEQAKTFNEAIGIDAIILSKADIDEKGGAAVSVSYITEKPILYLGVGQNYEDMIKFEPGLIMDKIGLS
ncbi:MAG: signal recognition particle-docking protein FtsY [Nanoarchaeota archaeon]